MRRRRVLPAAALAVAVAIAAGCGGDPGPPEQDGTRLGDGDALLAVVTSVGCEPCARFHGRVLPRIVERYVRPGDLEVRTVLLVPPDDAAARMTAAIHAAGLQDRFYDALGAAFRTPPPGDADALLRSIEGLDVARARRDLASGEVAAAMREDRALAARLGLDAAPAVLAGRDEDELRPIRAPNLSEAELAEVLDDLVQ